MRYSFPYSEFDPVDIPDERLAGVYELPPTAAAMSDPDLIRSALDDPIGCGRLRDEVKPGMRIAVVVDDCTRNTKTDLMLPVVLGELDAAAIDRSSVCIFIALGTHRQMSDLEIQENYTREIVRSYRFVNHDWKDLDAYVSIGSSSRGFDIRIHREILAADFVIGVGQTIPHLIAGFGGGGKIINPGCADSDTIGQMHWMCSLAPEDKLFAWRENVVRDVIDEVALKAGLKFILNEVPGSNHRLAGAFAGHPIEAHRKACELARKVCEVKLREKTDIVLADAYPSDIDFWQALKGVNAAYGAVRDGGTVIVVSPCPEGASSQHPEVTTLGYIPVEQTKAMVDRGDIDRCIAANLLLGRRLLDRARGVLVTKGISQADTTAMGFDWAPDPQVAVEQAFERHGPDVKVNVLHKAAKMICTV